MSYFVLFTRKKSYFVLFTGKKSYFVLFTWKEEIFCLICKWSIFVIVNGLSSSL